MLNCMYDIYCGYITKKYSLANLAVKLHTNCTSPTVKYVLNCIMQRYLRPHKNTCTSAAL